MTVLGQKAEIAFPLGLPHGIDVNDLSVQRCPIYPERRSSELQDMSRLGLENGLKCVPGRCRGVMGFVYEEVGAEFGHPDLHLVAALPEQRKRLPNTH